ncbi:MAG: hypothetical protein IT302_09650 [Dehalococcoidia bacterium]|nr:hypothetical protein [Dehalococcoidia bacterium]
MPLQNRVTPFGELVAVPARGTLTGNRGIIHDDSRRIVRQWANPHWIACLLEFRGRRREVMSPGRWTELFFLDEATAFAAGHRPCFFCRRADATRFAGAWAAGQGVGVPPRVDEMDHVLHAERIARPGRGKRLHPLPPEPLPAGAMVTDGKGTAWVACEGSLWRWSFDGYRAEPPTPGTPLLLVTPPSVVAALAAGYAAGIHASARG